VPYSKYEVKIEKNHSPLRENPVFEAGFPRHTHWENLVPVENLDMEKNHLVITRKPWITSRTLYRVAAVGIATLITQASPGGAASSWGVECLTTDLNNNSYCVTLLSDDIPSDSAAWTLRKSVEDANTRAVTSATIGFKDALFGIQRNDQGQVTNNSQTRLAAAATPENPGEATNPTNTAKIVVTSTLEIKTNVTITAPTDSAGSPLLTIERGTTVAAGAPLIAINPVKVTEADPTGVAANKATTEVKIENVIIDSRSNPAYPQDASGVFSTPGVAISVETTIVTTENGSAAVTPTVVVSNSTIRNTLAESGGAAISTPGDVRVENSVLFGNSAVSHADGTKSDGGAINAQGSVTVVGSYSVLNSASGDGGVIKAEGSVTVQTSELTDNSATGNGGAISAGANVTVSGANLTDNKAIAGSGGAISAVGGVTATSTNLHGNTAGQSGGAISTGADVTVNDVGLNHNVAAAGSGGAISAGGDATVTASTFNGNNAASGSGGAIEAKGNVSVAGLNAASNTAGASGGAISAGGDVSVSSNSTLQLNTASQSGGAISAGAGVTVTASTFNGNNAASGSGGAIEAKGNVSVAALNAASNTAGASGGAISAGAGVTVTASTLNNNVAAAGSGGAISAGGDVTVAASTLSTNRANLGSGGAISTAGAVAVSDTSTVSSNVASENGGGISAGAGVTVTASTLNNNVAAAGSGGAISTTGAVVVTAGSEINSNYADQNGGGISAKTAFIKDSELSGNFSDRFGGAIHVKTSIIVQGSDFSTVEEEIPNYDPDYDQNEFIYVPNKTYGAGGAIYIEDGSDGDSEVTDSTFDSNEAGSKGGAIAGNLGKLTIDSSTFTNNIASGFMVENRGGAIWHAGTLEITNSNFLDNVSASIFAVNEIKYVRAVCTDAREQAGTFDQYLRVACASFGLQQLGFGSESGFGFGFGQFDDWMNPNSGGAIHVEEMMYCDPLFASDPPCEVMPTQTVTITDSGFIGNSTDGSGGAVFFLGLLQILGSRFEENWALMGNGGGVSGESIEVTGAHFEGNISGGSGGAVRATDGVRVQNSNNDGSNDWTAENFFLNNFARDNGGAISSTGISTVAGSSFDFNISGFDGAAISVVEGSLSVHNSSFQQNFSEGRGGAIFVEGTLSVINSIFGSVGEENISYNPERKFLNPDYIPEIFEPNPLFGNGQPPLIRNENYIPPLPNPDCTEDYSVIYDGQCFHNLGDDYWNQHGGDRPRFPLLIPNNTGPEFVVNELYSDVEFFYTAAVGERYIYVLDDSSKEYDPYKYIYEGNYSRESGGAIYVDGAATIKDSSFIGNISEDRGGAIRSYGSLEISDSQFLRNYAEESGGAIRTTPEGGDLFITRTSFIENVSLEDGGAIDISTGGDLHYDDVVLASYFRGNEAFEDGGAIYSPFAVLLMNTFEDNKSPEGQSLHLHGGLPSGNLFIGAAPSLVSSASGLCAHTLYGVNNFTTDESCFGDQEQASIYGGNVLLSHAEISDPIAVFTLPVGYGAELLETIRTFPEFFSVQPSVNKPEGVLSELGEFITNELHKDNYSMIRDSEVLWTAGHLQLIFPVVLEVVVPKVPKEETPVVPVVVSPVVPEVPKEETPILITTPILSSKEVALIAQLRAEQMAAELLRQQIAEKAAAERLAKIKADKLARDKARALAAEKRRAQLAALKAKIAATQARGEALKQKPSWTNLMKNSPTSKVTKKLVKMPTK
jgi:predicted outer membrane repeat protein